VEKSLLISSNLKKYLAYSWAIFFHSGWAANFAESLMAYGFENQHRAGGNVVIYECSQ
jgi:hypothetical protein